MKAFLDKWILSNWGTKLMAAFLGLLLWMYLHEESTDSGSFSAAFVPSIENRAEFARLNFSDNEGKFLGGKITINVTGPKGDLRVLTKKGIRCEPRVDPGNFDRNIGSFTMKLQEGDLNLPEALTVDFGSVSWIRVDYVRFNEANFDLPEPQWTGEPIAGFEVGEVTVRPPQVQLRFPADNRPQKIWLKPVSVDKRASSFNVEAELDRREELDAKVSLKTRPVVVVTLVPKKATFQADVPLHLSGPASVTSRLELLTTMIKVKVIGSATAVQAIRDDASNLLYAFVAVQIPEAQLEVGKPIPLTQIHCVVRDSLYAAEVQIIPMSDSDPDNREVIVKVVK